MEFLKWSKDISVDDVTIDRQHQKLFIQINLLKEALDSEASVGATLESLEGIPEYINFHLANLDEYINVHLAHEERYMKMHEYPGYDEHVKLHRGFIEKTNELRKDIGGDVNERLKVLHDFLVKWWLGHIVHEDQKYAAFIRDHEDSHPKDEEADYHSTDQLENET